MSNNNQNNLESNKLPLYANSDGLDFLCEEHFMDERYQGVEQILKLDENNPVFKIEDQNIIALEPFLDDSGKFNCYALKKNFQSSPESQKNLFYLMYQKWVAKKQKPRQIQIQQTRWTNEDRVLVDYTTENIHLAIGFSPRNYVYPNHYAFADEKLPDWIQEWLISDDDTQSKIGFIAALSVNTQDSDIVKLRTYLETKTEPVINTLLNSIHLLVNTLNWLKETQVKFKSGVDDNAFKLIRRIYDSLATESNLPWLGVEEIDDNLITYSFQSDRDNKYYFDMQVITDVLTPYKIELKVIWNVINHLDELLINKDYYPDAFSLDDVRAIQLNLRLDTNLLSESKESEEKYYPVWKEMIDYKFKIELHPGNIPYKIYFDKYDVGVVDLGEDIVINDNTIYINSKSSRSYEDLLETLINKNDFNFTTSELEKFKQAKNQPEEELKKAIARQQDRIDPTGKPDLPDIKYRCSDNDFSERRSEEEWERFSAKLLNSLNNNSSYYKGYIYHFTHVENAAKIIECGKLLARGSARFQDSAGENLISRTSEDIKNYFARFYFRPKTPTQWHNELLGRRDDKIGHILCPVPIFFGFKIEDVLNTHKSKCAISNGNLSSGWAHYGNSTDFLDYFNFEDLYNNYGQPNYKVASQQEFIVKDGLDFSNGDIDFKIICINSQDRQTLINLLGSTSEYKEKIKINSSFYYNESPYVKVEVTETSIDASLMEQNYDKKIPGAILFSSQGEIDLKSISSNAGNIINVQVEPKLVEAKTHFSIECDRPTSFKVFYREDQQDWLIYQHEH